MYGDPGQANYYLDYLSLATLYRLISAGLLDDYIEMYEGQFY